jgi:flavodoxin
MITLVAYFSWGGTTRQIAQKISSDLSVNLFEIKAVKAYPEEYGPCTEIAKKEQQENARPALAGKMSDIDQYDTIVLCYPCWWGTMPQACFTFLESYNLTGKTIAPLCTSGGSGLARSPADIKKLCPSSTIKSGLSIRERDVTKLRFVQTSDQAIKDWLKDTGITG